MDPHQWSHQRHLHNTSRHMDGQRAIFSCYVSNSAGNVTTSGATSTVAQNSLGQGLLAYWKFDEGSGTTA